MANALHDLSALCRLLMNSLSCTTTVKMGWITMVRDDDLVVMYLQYGNFINRMLIINNTITCRCL